jgi:anti-sigma factor RsiW
MAAGWLVAFGIGWVANSPLLGEGGLPRLAQDKTTPEFVHQASLAHTVYTPELRHPVEVRAAEQEHLVQWLSKRLGKQLKIPTLLDQGFSLVGGRLLPGEAGARAQFMFKNPAGLRLTLYLGAVDPARLGTQPGDSGETAFRLATVGAVPSFYWVDRGFGYALSAAMPSEELLKLASAVYRQL